MYNFILNFLFVYCYILFLPVRVAASSIERICASSLFVQMKNSNTPYYQLCLLNIFRTFEAQILEIFKNIKPQRQN